LVVGVDVVPADPPDCGVALDCEVGVLDAANDEIGPASSPPARRRSPAPTPANQRRRRIVR